MKKIQKILFIPLLALFLPFALYDVGYAFHGGEGGTDYCKGCHVLHGSQMEEAQGMDKEDNTAGGTLMLIGADPSSTCLRCHGETGKFYNVFSKDGSTYSPGGDFYWLTKTFTWYVDGRIYVSLADSHGHNIVASEYGLTSDRELSFSPGGLYPSFAMGCTSCHDPHGTTGDADGFGGMSVPGTGGESPNLEASAGHFRLLGGVGYDGGAQAAGIYFEFPAPVGAGNKGNWTEHDANHTAYGSGMSEWCGNCHAGFLGGGNHLHPSGSNGILSNPIMSNYNGYRRTGDLTGTQSSAYLALVPFELGIEDEALLDPFDTSGPGAKGKANVMCLTCHRAHASAFKNIGRWDMETTFISKSHPNAGDSGATANDEWNSYYGRDMVAQFGIGQRQLCNKCHSMD